MRILFVSALLLASAAAVSAQTPPPTPLSFDVPSKPTTVSILHRVFKPGEHVGMHTHAGVEMSQIISGDFDVIEDGKTIHHHAGDIFMVPRGVKHDGRNVGKTDAVVAVTYVLDKGAPLRTPVPEAAHK